MGQTASCPLDSAILACTKSTSSGTLLVTGYPGNQRKVVAQPNPSATAPAIDAMRSRMRERLSGRSVRTVPPMVAVRGITLNASPAWIAATVSTTASKGSDSRLTNACRAVTIWAAHSTGSWAYCGAAACPPVPSTNNSNRSAAANMGPGIEPA